MRTVLVTGYGGFLGGAIARKLIAAGYQVRGLARSKYPDFASSGIECVAGSINDRAVVEHAVAGCDAVIHTAALAGVWGPWSHYYNVNTLGTQLLLESALKNQCRAFVFTSSPSVTFDARDQSGIDETTTYPKRWLCHYPHTKAIAEQATLRAASERLGTCALRPHLIWGHGDPHLMPRVIQKAKAGKLKCVGTGDNLIDIVHVDNAADAHLQALEKLLDRDASVNGQAFFLTDGTPVQCWHWIRNILQAAEIPVPTGRISFQMAYRIGAVLEAAYGAMRIKSEPPMTRFVAAQLAMDHYFSIDKARRLLGYNPKQNRDELLHECKPWLRSLA